MRARALPLGVVIVVVAAITAGAFLLIPDGSPRVPTGFAGMTSELVDSPPATQTAALDAQRSIGVRLERQPFRWREIETSPGVYDFARYDSFMANVARRRIQTLALVYDPPWFRSARPDLARNGRMAPPRDDAEYARFLSMLVRRYGRSGSFWSTHPSLPREPIVSWQIWNEPNLPAYWEPKPDAHAYAQLLLAAHSAIKAADPGAEVVSAGLPNSSSSGIPFATYAPELLSAAGPRAFDTFAIHPYAATPDEVLATVAQVRGLLDARGARSARIWVTEVGWASAGPPSAFTVGPQAQADNVRSTIEGLARLRKRDRIRGFVLYNWQDIPPMAGVRDFWGLHSGLLAADGTRKPAFAAFTAALREIAG